VVPTSPDAERIGRVIVSARRALLILPAFVAVALAPSAVPAELSLPAG